MRDSVSPWFWQSSSEPSVDLARSRDSNASGLQGIEYLKGVFESNNLPIPIYVDLSLADTAIRVVRVVCPRLEIFAKDPYRIGFRARKWLTE